MQLAVKGFSMIQLFTSSTRQATHVVVGLLKRFSNLHLVFEQIPFRRDLVAEHIANIS